MRAISSVPDAPGPPGLTKRAPRRRWAGTVAGNLRTAREKVAGLEALRWSQGTVKKALQGGRVRSEGSGSGAERKGSAGGIRVAVAERAAGRDEGRGEGLPFGVWRVRAVEPVHAFYRGRVWEDWQRRGLVVTMMGMVGMMGVVVRLRRVQNSVSTAKPKPHPSPSRDGARSIGEIQKQAGLL